MGLLFYIIITGIVSGSIFFGLNALQGGTLPLYVVLIMCVIGWITSLLLLVGSTGCQRW